MNGYDRNWCINLFNDLIKMPIARPFLRPVDPIADGAPDYLEIVADPVDFSAIGSKLRAKHYDSPAAFVSDLQLLCANAIEYNGADSMISEFARSTETFPLGIQLQMQKRPGRMVAESHGGSAKTRRTHQCVPNRARSPRFLAARGTAVGVSSADRCDTMKNAKLINCSLF
jgi:hypothetical protein